jgi:hypothetical protein
MAPARGPRPNSSPANPAERRDAEVTGLGRGRKRPGAGRKPGSPNKHTGASIAADVKEALAFLARINGRVDELAERIDSIGGRVSSVKSAVTDGSAAIDDRLDLMARRLVRLERAADVVTTDVTESAGPRRRSS